MGLIRPFYKLINSSRAIRGLLFDLKDSRLTISSGDCIFVVSTSDVTIGRSVYSTNIPFDIDKLESVIKLIGCSKENIVDIGANIGTICIGGIKKGFFKKGYAVEPDPQNFALLSANVTLNQLTQAIEIRNIALGENDDSVLNFELCEDNHGDHRIQVNKISPLFNESSRSVIQVESQTFDKTLHDVDFSNTLIWIDVQGYEGHVLSKASKALKNRPPICMEFWPYGLERSGCYELLKNALTSHGYEYFYDLTTPSLMLPLNNATLDALKESIGISGGYTDILCL